MSKPGREEMKLAIVGSRTFNDYAILASGILKFTTVSKIISGGAKGADHLAEDFAENWDIPIDIFKPDWDKYGKQAGFIRNQLIVDACDMVVAFWDGKSKGTQDTILKAKKAKKPTFIIYF